MGLWIACRPTPKASAPASSDASAFIIKSTADLPTGPAASAALGDVRMQNGQLVAILAAAQRAVGFAYSGGNLVDLSRVGREDHLNQVFLYLDDHFPRQARYSTLDIIEPGGDGKRAVARARGVDSGNARILVETDYVLEPSSRYLTLVSRFTNTTTTTIKTYELGDAMQWGRSEHLAPGLGYDISGKRFPCDWIAGLGRESSYALVRTGTTPLVSMNGSVWSDAYGDAPDVPPGATVEHVRHIAVGLGDSASFMDDVFALRGDDHARIHGMVTHKSAPITDGEIHVLDEKGGLTGVARTSAKGEFSILVRPGIWKLVAYGRGRDHVTPTLGKDTFELKAGESRELSFEMGPRASIAFEVFDLNGAPLPARVTIVGVDGTETPDLGPLYVADGARNVVLSKNGKGEVPVGKGRYRVIASRGPEYEIFDSIVEVSLGELERFSAKLERSVDTTGFVAVDSHQHSAPSMDSGVSLPDRALSNAVEGVELLVSTDHNVIIDHAASVAGLGLSSRVKTVMGTEATTHSVGHFNGFPLAQLASDPRGGMKDVEGMTPREIIELLGSLAPRGVTPFIQVNHPRAGDIGYFDLMKLDPKKGTAADPRFVGGFDAIEVLSFRFRDETYDVLNDWFALLSNGHVTYSVGSSDSHTIFDREVGWPRSLVCSSTDDPEKIDPVEIAKAMKAGCSTASAGIFATIEAEKDGRHTKMGGLVSAKDGKITLRARAYAPMWVPADRMYVYRDGAVTHQLRPSSTGVTRFDEKLEVECKADCFLVVMVESDTSLEPVISKYRNKEPKPMGLTNPIFVDVDGDGRFKGSAVPPMAQKTANGKG